MEKKRVRLARRKKRVKSRIGHTGYRLNLSRSNRYLFAQIIDQKTGKVIIGMTDKALLPAEGAKKTKTERAKILGMKLAQMAVERKIIKIVFDRSSFRYHGRVKAFAEGAREGGLKF